MLSQQFHSCFFELWTNCGTVEEKATNTSTTVVVCICILLWWNVDYIKLW
jgi:hypothetical protein